MRLIDADKAIGRYYAEWEKQDISDGAQDRDWLKQCIDDAPAIDAVPVVRCKDCIHSISYVDKSGAIAYVVCNLDEDSDEIELRTPVDYCSYGEREEANK